MKMVIGKKCSPIENVADLFSYVCPEAKKLAVDSVESGFEKISFSRVLAIKEFQQLAREEEGREGGRKGGREGEREVNENSDWTPQCMKLAS